MKINVPENLDDITLGQYQNFLKTTEFADASASDILRIFYNFEDISVLKQADVERYIEIIYNILFKEEDYKGSRLLFEIDKKQFGFIPNLDDITFGENKDIVTYINSWETMHKAMAVLFRPVTLRVASNYQIEKYKGTAIYAEEMRKMPLSVVKWSHVFFWNLTTDLSKTIQNYTYKKKAMLPNFANYGEDIAKSITLQEGIFSSKKL